MKQFVKYRNKIPKSLRKRFTIICDSTADIVRNTSTEHSGIKRYFGEFPFHKIEILSYYFATLEPRTSYTAISFDLFYHDAKQLSIAFAT
jgi:hypothetical protein